MSDSDEDLAFLTGAPAAPPTGDVTQEEESTTRQRHEKKKKDKKSKKDKKKKEKHSSKSKRHRAEETPALDDDAARARRLVADDDESDDDDIVDFDKITEDESSDDERRGGGLLDDAADEGEDDEEEERVRPEDVEEERLAKERIRQHRRATTGLDALRDMTNEEAERYFEEQNKLRKLAAATTQGGVDRQLSGDSSLRFSADFLPREGDPKVFAVKVRPGFARILVARIVNKCRAYLRGENEAKMRQDLGIMSVFSVDHVKEWIYLEAHRQRFVETAITGLEHVFRFKITQVDPKELMQLFARQSTKKDELRVGDYVRVKAGLYANDIAIVDSLQEEGRTAVLKLMPRENYNGQTQREPFKKSLRHPQQLFVPKLAIGAHERHTGDWTWSGLTFNKDGYLLQSFLSNRLLFGSNCPPPTVEELVVYHSHNKDAVTHAVETLGLPALQAKAAHYKKDEPVKVVSGQLAGMEGRVVVSDKNRLTIATAVNEGCTFVSVAMDEVSKMYVPGTHVVIEAGPHAGEAGTVVHTTATEAIVLTDEGQRELKVDTAHCRASHMKAVRPHSHGALALFDLVELSDDKGVGCIVGFRGNTVSVMTPNNVVIATTAEHIKQKFKGKNTTIDRLTNSVTARDAIVVDDSAAVPREYHKIRGTVQQVHIGTLFVTSSQLRTHAGMFAISAKNVTRIGGQSKHQKQSTFATLKTVYREPHPAKQAHIEGIAGVRSVMSMASARTVDHDIDPHDLF